MTMIIFNWGLTVLLFFVILAVFTYAFFKIKTQFYDAKKTKKDSGGGAGDDASETSDDHEKNGQKRSRRSLSEQMSQFAKEYDFNALEKRVTELDERMKTENDATGKQLSLFTKTTKDLTDMVNKLSSLDYEQDSGYFKEKKLNAI